MLGVQELHRLLCNVGGREQLDAVADAGRQQLHKSSVHKLQDRHEAWTEEVGEIVA